MSEETSGTKPSHIAYMVEEIEGYEKGRWTELGAVWPHKDGLGFNVDLKAFPRDGQLVLRPPKQKD